MTKIKLRKLKESDAEDMYTHVKEKEVSRWMLRIPHPYKLSDAKQFIQKVQERKNEYTFGIVLQETNELVGVLTLRNIDNTHKNVELAYWLGKQFWNQGIMTEAIKQIVSFAKNKLKMHRIYATAFETNKASQRVLEKNGFVKEGLIRDKFFKDNKWHNAYLYA
ncbi:MAG TPA: GNAT family N-acetyltransferase [Candidatus Nanoarchaeia archaeon]|nr:GNAT family N-acetyltransferase [Candidatus Nanoarchaeia archaeon]